MAQLIKKGFHLRKVIVFPKMAFMRGESGFGGKSNFFQLREVLQKPIMKTLWEGSFTLYFIFHYIKFRVNQPPDETTGWTWGAVQFESWIFVIKLNSRLYKNCSQKSNNKKKIEMVISQNCQEPKLM